MTTKSTASIIAGFLLTFSTSVAVAQTDQFSFKAHELETTQGVEELYKRIEFKAAQSCVQNGIRPLYAKSLERECKNDLVGQFVASISDRRLSSYHAAITTNNANYASK